VLVTTSSAASSSGHPLPPADATFTISEIVRRVGTSLRTVRHYVAEKVVVPPPFRSSNTRYDRAFLVRFQAARALRKKGEHLPAIRARLDAMAFEEMARLAGYAPDLEATGGSGTGGPGAGQAAAVRALPAGFVGAYRAGPAQASERWEHFEVCPGVKLLVRTEADSEAWRVAREMLALFGR